MRNDECASILQGKRTSSRLSVTAWLYDPSDSVSREGDSGECLPAFLEGPRDGRRRTVAESIRDGQFIVLASLCTQDQSVAAFLRFPRIGRLGHAAWSA